MFLWAVFLLGTGLAHAAASAAPPADHGNGVIGQISGEGGDATLGARLYTERCAGCHDHPAGRIPSRTAIADNTRALITTTLSGGIMRPMARGLSLHEMASIATYLSHRTAGLVSGGGAEAPPCNRKPAAIDLKTADQWNGWGRTEQQARYQPDPGFTAAEVGRLKLKWAFAYANSRGGQATVVGDRLFLNASSGTVYALNARTGCAYWRFDAPAPTRGSIVVGRLRGAPSGYAIYFTDYTRSAYALDADSGALVWKSQVDSQHEVQMTGSVALHDGRLFVPISSAEEAIAADPRYQCCQFRGAVAALDATTGELLWKTYVTPAVAKPFKRNAAGTQMFGPAGGAIWSAPTIDAKRRLVYVATGDSYTDLPFDRSDAILALDERTGAIRWSNQLTRDDNYIEGCHGPGRTANCPTRLGPDHDFGASPILHSLSSGRQVLLVGQKSGEVYALDPDHGGKVVWSRRVSPGGPLGGVEFGLAADDETLYVPVSDIYVPAALANPGITALRIADGAVLWTARTPRKPCAWDNVYCFPGVSQAISVVPGAVFGGSMDGRFRAFDAATGSVIWEYNTAAAQVMSIGGHEAQGGVLDGAGPTVAGGMVYVNSGYWGRSGRPGTVLMAFSIGAR
ncbi:PQQ-binding-like beta-propeller repeat protein [Rhodopila sp.]|uniref:outer membrane protein assembly factor BamB family protein n=1 Tax=Rhodopila sp. TaxID=2480087 RepID=UPI003D147D9D